MWQLEFFCAGFLDVFWDVEITADPLIDNHVWR